MLSLNALTVAGSDSDQVTAYRIADSLPLT